MGKMWKAAEAYNCRGLPGHINIHQGEKVEELEPDDNGWTKVKTNEGEEGLVPTDCLAIGKSP